VDHNSLTADGLRNLIALRQGKHASIPASVKPVILQREYTSLSRLNPHREIVPATLGSFQGSPGEIAG
jgi:hypothetical protein